MWPLTFISEEQFTKHVQETIEKYDKKLESFDLKKFNKNIIDPVKLIFDKTVYHASWDEIVSNEIFRQRDKSNNNDIGYFHQWIFKYIARCAVPKNGEDNGWDVVFEDEKGIVMSDDVGTVNRVFVEMKNKHNTLNKSSKQDLFIKMQNQLLQDDNCACLLVEAIAKKSEDVKWGATVRGKKVSHKLIRRMSIDKFYALVTGQEDAFYQMCMVLPDVIKKAVNDTNKVTVPNDTVLEELQAIANENGGDGEGIAMAVAVYMLGFESYNGFKK